MADLFANRVPEAAARQLAVVFINLLECQLATLEGLPKSISKAERKRQQLINERYLAQLIDLDVDPETPGLLGYRCQRVIDAVRRIKEGRNG